MGSEIGTMTEKYNDEMYEVDDIDADIAAKKELIKEAEALKEEDDLGAALKKASQLQRQWKQIHSWESGYEEDLRQEFDENLDQVYAKRNQWYEVVKEKKNFLIREAKALSDNENWKEATQKMNELMNRWKESGTAGKKVDDELWDKFRDARQTFFDKKDEYFEGMRHQFENAKDKKEELIEKAIELKDSEQWQDTSKKFQDLMDQWKQIGSAGKEYEQALWDRFNEARQSFYSKRNEHYDKLHAQQEQVYEQKKELIQQAQDVLDKEDFSKENTEFMKSLNAKWKESGHAGKKLEDEIWPLFKQTLDSYFDGLKQWTKNRHQNWIDRMEQTKARKQDLIENQKRAIKRLEDDMNGLVSETQRNEMEEEVKEKEEFIQQLENEIQDIEKKLEDQ